MTTQKWLEREDAVFVSKVGRMQQQHLVGMYFVGDVFVIGSEQEKNAHYAAKRYNQTHW